MAEKSKQSHQTTGKQIQVNRSTPQTEGDPHADLTNGNRDGITAQQVNFALHEYQAKETMGKLINMEQDNWKQVTRPQRRRYTNQKRLGTAEVNEDFRGAGKKVWIYLYRIQNNATEQKIIEYIKKQDGFENERVTVKEIPDAKSQLKKFVLTASFKKKDQLYDTAFWPANVGIRRFDFEIHRDFLRSEAANFL